MPPSIRRNEVDRTWDLCGLTYDEMIHLREMFKGGCERVQHDMAETGGMPTTEEEAQRVAFVQHVYLTVKAAVR